MGSEEKTVDYKFFVDEKFSGIEKLNDSYTNNVSSVAKLIRIFKEFSLAQDVYSKCFLKSNISLAQLAKCKTDCFHPIIEAFSVTFCSFANIQKEFTDSLNLIIRNLTSSFDNNNENLGRVLTTRDTNVVTNFKNIQFQMIKAQSKYISTISENNDVASKRLKENYETSVSKYNTMRIHFMDVMKIGFDRVKEIHCNHLDIMRKLIKDVGNALARLMIDMKESVDSVKKFYKTISKDSMFRLWVNSNKTNENTSIECFPTVVVESQDCSLNDGLLVDIDHSPPTNHSSATSTSEGKRNKIVQARSNTEQLTDNGQNIIDQDIPDALTTDTNTNDKKHFEKNNNAFKYSKSKFTPLSFFKRFQSTSDLTTTSDNKDSQNEDCWQSKSNLNEKVAVDDEGFIIRDTLSDTKNRSSDSSSSESNTDNRIRGIKVSIRPVTNSIRKIATKSEIVTAAIQLPTPKRDKVKYSDARRVSNLQRSPRTVTDNVKDRFHRRAMSVSELQCTDNNPESIINIVEQAKQEIVVIPIASAMTEILSSNDGGKNCVIHGQLVLAWPLYLKDYMRSALSNSMPDSIAFDIISETNAFLSAQITKQYKDVTSLEMVNSKTYTVILLKELLHRIISDPSLATKGTRISLPILEYSMEVNNSLENLIECHEQWSKLDENLVQFFFTVSSKYTDDKRDITINIKLLSGGIIEHLSSNGNGKPEIYNPQFWSIKVGKSDYSISVTIKHDNQSLIRLKLGYEFVFENCSLAKPVLNLKSDSELDPIFKISLMHYRTISTGNFSQLFDFSI